MPGVPHMLAAMATARKSAAAPLAVRVAGGSDSCPKGTAYYQCADTDFFGCCSVDPCSMITCPDGEAVTPSRAATKSSTKTTTSRRPTKSTPTTTTDSSSDMTSTAAASSPSTSRRTDSGVTHTISNSSVVTVTRHTTVFSEAPSSSTEDPSLRATPSSTVTVDDQSTDMSSSATSVTPAATSSSPATPDALASPLSSGTIVAIAVGGTAFIAIVIVLIWAAFQRRRKQKRGVEGQIPSGFVMSSPGGGYGPGRDDGSGVEKYMHHQQRMSAHTTGRPDNADPFAPFGGRVDRPQEQRPRATSTFEMSGIAVPPVQRNSTGAMPMELSAEHASQTGPTAPASFASGGIARPRSYQPYTPGCEAGGFVSNPPATDPRANLRSIRTESGSAGYVNHWDEWRALGGGGTGAGT
ncbi:HNRNP arginine N-methyltransferase [Purpureocillium lavendulum]|uniref:HNRNP arginine N-methyltransferase n=1 Tax=Purpureocillium lavendulum TaxID=1247861 RepID=A0AB34G5F1_9HYPO|nr:HNRNP arginine N-methyltransferase [Purpureocillium lavendulum]